MQTHIQARGFSLTQSLLDSAHAQIADFRKQFPHYQPVVSVRMYDVNGLHGGADKGCLAMARLGKRRISVVASDVDTDLYQAISSAFVKLTRATRTALTRARTLSRNTLQRGKRRSSRSAMYGDASSPTM
jgi:ribosome-associated translation inhibitor RaiA